MNKQEAKETVAILKALLGITEVAKILNTFIPAFEKGIAKEDGRTYLHGNFNVTGTASGRMSSSGPNLQQIPSTGTKYAKLIKHCFQAPEGWIMIGADFSSLEDRIAALITKDPNKLKVYTDGYDGHSLRAYNYYSDLMPDIDPSSVESINSIDKKYKALRQASKAPTFALTYQGTWSTLVKNCGLDPDKAKEIEAKYHELYSVSDNWVQNKLQEASKTGYVQGAFGLKLRTPILKQCLLNKRSTPKEAQAEGRTAGNMLGQSYGLLNNRALIEFMDRVYKSKYKLDIKPIATVHDSIYTICKKDPEVIHWLNINLIECMEWQELEDIKHPEVKLGAELELYFRMFNIL